MAEDADSTDEARTFDPTERRLTAARDRGDVPRYAFFPVLIGFCSAIILLKFVWTGLIDRLQNTTKIAWSELAFQSFPENLKTILIGLDLLIPALFAGTAGLLQALAGCGILRGMQFHPDRIEPKLENISPRANFGRRFGLKALVHATKALVAASASIGVASYLAISGWPGSPEEAISDATTLFRIVPETSEHIWWAATFVVATTAVVDVFVQRKDWLRKLKMTRQEIREEQREAEGDPAMKRRMRDASMRRSRSRMLAAVAGADVLVVNPSHVAVALRYDQKRDIAPVVVSKGTDEFAERMKLTAIARDVPIYEDRWVARSLLAECAVGAAVPPRLYRAVAAIFIFVGRASQAAR